MITFWWTVIASASALAISIFSSPHFKKWWQKPLFVMCIVLNLMGCIMLAIQTNKENNKHEEREITATESTRRMLAKQDSIQHELNEIGLKANFFNGTIQVNNIQNLVQSMDSLKRTILISQPPTDTQKISISAMEDNSCIDVVRKIQYTKVCIDNKTGKDIVLDRYFGYSGLIRDEKQVLPANQITCTGNLRVDYLTDRVAERNFTFYFKTTDGVECKYPYRVTLKSCQQYTITLVAADIGL